jgi:hypothetical protein
MNFGSKEIKDLLEQYRRRECSEADRERFYDLINDPNYESRIKEVLQFDLINFQPNESEKRGVEFSNIYRNIQAAIQPQKQIPIDFQKYSGHQSNKRTIQATAILIFVFIGGGVSSYFIFKGSTTPSLLNSYNEIKAPLGVRSGIRLPDGSRVRKKSYIFVLPEHLKMKRLHKCLTSLKFLRPLIINSKGRMYIFQKIKKRKRNSQII